VAVACELVVKSNFFNIGWIYVPLLRPIPKEYSPGAVIPCEQIAFRNSPSRMYMNALQVMKTTAASSTFS